MLVVLKSDTSENENSYSYDFSAVTDVSLSVFFLSKHGKLLALFCLNLGFKLKIFPGLISPRIFTTFIFVKTWGFSKFPNICWKWLVQSIKCRKKDMVLTKGWKFWFAFYQTFKEWSPLYLSTLKFIMAHRYMNLFWLKLISYSFSGARGWSQHFESADWVISLFFEKQPTLNCAIIKVLKLHPSSGGQGIK